MFDVCFHIILEEVHCPIVDGDAFCLIEYCVDPRWSCLETAFESLRATNILLDRIHYYASNRCRIVLIESFSKIITQVFGTVSLLREGAAMHGKF